MTILKICEQNFENQGKMCKIVDNMLLSVSIYKKVNVLEYIVNLINITAEEKKAWMDFFESVYDLIKKRNIYAHNMFGIEGETIIKFTNKKDVNGLTIEKKIEVNELKADVNELRERYRQLFDSIIDETNIWISHYPQLKYRETNFEVIEK